ncbi:MAG: NAD(P)H-dependent oxidoreductase, partial [Bacteroidales bacterium]|nr:NAD(P)H-dependent oxidoreductase [Bacteroidales bacterium]
SVYVKNLLSFVPSTLFTSLNWYFSGMKLRNKILVLFAHPAMHKSRVNRRLIDSIKDIEDVAVHDLYEKYPDFHIDVNREQQLLLEHDIIVWQHPFYWYSSPSLLKEWIDLVLQHGFAYGKSGTALRGKQVLTAITTGGRREVYQDAAMNEFSIPQFLAPFDRTARLCNMDYLPPFVVHGTHLLNEEEMDAAALNYRSLLISLRDELFSMDEIMECYYLNDLLTKSEKH